MSDDMTLLREYAATGSEAAFGELVHRHLGMVRSAAARQVGDEQLAEDIAQAVFIILTKKAGSLGPKTVLAAWLCRTASYAAADARKARRRRLNREEAAIMQAEVNNLPDPDLWSQLAPVPDEELNQLGEADRAVLVLRYFKDQTVREMAEAFQQPENTVQKRVLRAEQKLRARLLKRGVTATAAALAVTVTANAVQAAPATLAAKISAVAAAKGAVMATTTVVTMVQGTLKLMAWAKAKITISVGIGILVAGGVGFIASKEIYGAAQRIKRDEQQMVNQSLVVAYASVETNSDHNILMRIHEIWKGTQEASRLGITNGSIIPYQWLAEYGAYPDADGAIVFIPSNATPTNLTLGPGTTFVHTNRPRSMSIQQYKIWVNALTLPKTDNVTRTNPMVPQKN